MSANSGLIQSFRNRRVLLPFVIPDACGLETLNVTITITLDGIYVRGSSQLVNLLVISALFAY